MTFEIDVTERGAIVRYAGEASYEGIAGAVSALADHPDFRPDVPTVWDFSKVSSVSQMGADDMRRVARVVAPLRVGGGRPRVAIVTPRDSNFAGARMFSGLNASQLSIDLSVFRDVVEAERWAFSEASAGGSGAGDVAVERRG